MISHGLAPLAARGNRIVDAQSGRPVLLRGINRSGLEYTYPAGALDDAEFDRIVSQWGANIVRLTFNQEWALAREDYDPATYLAAIDSAIQACARRGAYTLLALQWLDARIPRGYLAAGRPNFIPTLPDAGSVELWRQLAARYRDEPAVLYDIFSEPHDPLPGDPERGAPVTMLEWAPWAAALVEAIRSTGAQAPIFVSGLNWAYDLSGLPLSGLEGLVYSTHVYRIKGRGWDRAFGDLAATHPVFAGEWGGGDDDVEWGRNLAAYFDERGIGWTVWGWPDSPPLIDADANPTTFGLLIRSLLFVGPDGIRRGGW